MQKEYAPSMDIKTSTDVKYISSNVKILASLETILQVWLE